MLVLSPEDSKGGQPGTGLLLGEGPKSFRMTALWLHLFPLPGTKLKLSSSLRPCLEPLLALPGAGLSGPGEQRTGLQTGPVRGCAGGSMGAGVRDILRSVELGLRRYYSPCPTTEAATTTPQTTCTWGVAEGRGETRAELTAHRRGCTHTWPASIHGRLSFRPSLRGARSVRCPDVDIHSPASQAGTASVQGRHSTDSGKAPGPAPQTCSPPFGNIRGPCERRRPGWPRGRAPAETPCRGCARVLTREDPTRREPLAAGGKSDVTCPPPPRFPTRSRQASPRRS